MQQKISVNEDLYKKIKLLAKNDYRTIGGELEYIIKKYELLTPTQPDQPQPDITFTPDKVIEEYECRMSDPNNEYYEKIKEYFTRIDPDTKAFTELLQLVDEDNLNAIIKDYDYSIKKALGIALTHNLTRSDWKGIIECLR